MDRFASGQIVTVFRSRLRPEHEAEYQIHSAEMAALAATMPGLIEFKTFAADDGERVTLVTFESAEAQAAWRNHEEHREAQRRGRTDYYAAYSVQVCSTLRATGFGDVGGRGDH